MSTKSTTAVRLLPSRRPAGINGQKTQQNNHISTVACSNQTSPLLILFLCALKADTVSFRKCIIALGQTKVLIMHRKLSKDKVLRTERLWRSSRGFAALLEGNLIEANEEGESIQHSHPPTYDFLTRKTKGNRRDESSLNQLLWMKGWKKTDQEYNTFEKNWVWVCFCFSFTHKSSQWGCWLCQRLFR